MLAIPVLESMAYHVNFPADYPLHAGLQYHNVAQNAVLGRADVILAIDSDVPWIPSVNRPPDDAAIYCIDVDPLKLQMTMWHVALRRETIIDGLGGGAPAHRSGLRAGACKQASEGSGAAKARLPRRYAVS